MAVFNAETASKIPLNLLNLISVSHARFYCYNQLLRYLIRSSAVADNRATLYSEMSLCIKSTKSYTIITLQILATHCICL